MVQLTKAFNAFVVDIHARAIDRLNLVIGQIHARHMWPAVLDIPRGPVLEFDLSATCRHKMCRRQVGAQDLNTFLVKPGTKTILIRVELRGPGFM